MAHTCPKCGIYCHCGGDIDDIDFGEDCEAADACTCCDEEDGDNEFDYDDIGTEE